MPKLKRNTPSSDPHSHELQEVQQELGRGSPPSASQQRRAASAPLESDGAELYPWEHVPDSEVIHGSFRMPARLREQIRFISEHAPPKRAGSFNRIVLRALEEFARRELARLDVPEHRID